MLHLVAYERHRFNCIGTVFIPIPDKMGEPVWINKDEVKYVEGQKIHLKDKGTVLHIYESHEEIIKWLNGVQ